MPPRPNNPPVAGDFIRNSTTGALEVGTLVATDPDAGQRLSYVLFTEPAHGVAHVDAAGGLVYRSDSDFAGIDTFQYQVQDDSGSGGSATVTLQFAPLHAFNHDYAVAYDKTAPSASFVASPGVLTGVQSTGGNSVDPATLVASNKL